jgi:hypothetical protein
VHVRHHAKHRHHSHETAPASGDKGSGPSHTIAGTAGISPAATALRVGHSDGGAGVAAERAASLGFELTPRKDQAWSLGAGWARSSASELRDEYMVESSYKLQLWRNFSLLPDVQLLLDPANHPDESSVWVLGLRAILTL